MELVQIITSMGSVFWPFLVLMIIIPIFSSNPMYQSIVFWIVALALLGYVLFSHDQPLPITRIFIPKEPPKDIRSLTEEEKVNVQIQPLQITYDDALRLTFSLMVLGLLFRLLALWVDFLPTRTSYIRHVKKVKASENIQDLYQFLRTT